MDWLTVVEHQPRSVSSVGEHDMGIEAPNSQQNSTIDLRPPWLNVVVERGFRLKAVTGRLHTIVRSARLTKLNAVNRGGSRRLPLFLYTHQDLVKFVFIGDIERRWRRVDQATCLQ